MPVRSVIDLDVNTAKFDAFLVKWHNYQQSLTNSPQWHPGAPGLGGGGGGGGGPAGGGGGSGGSGAGQQQRAIVGQRAVTSAERLAKAWSTMKDSTASVVHNVTDMVQRMTRLTALVGIVSGIATGFGFLGMDAMGRTANGWRRTAMGLGASVGGARSFGLNYSRFVDTQSVLSGVATAMRDPKSSVALGALHVTPGAGEDTADVASRALSAARDLAKRTDDRLLGATFEANKLSTLGLTLQDFTRLKASTDEEFKAQQGHFGKDSRTLGMSDADLRKWADFNTALDRSKQNIETVFIQGLTPLAPAFAHLSESLTKLISAGLKKLSDGGYIDKLAAGIEKFAGYISTPQFEKDVSDFVESVGKMGAAITSFLRMIGMLPEDPEEKAKRDLKQRGITGPVAGDPTPDIGGWGNGPRGWQWYPGKDTEAEKRRRDSETPSNDNPTPPPEEAKPPPAPVDPNSTIGPDLKKIWHWLVPSAAAAERPGGYGAALHDAAFRPGGNSAGPAGFGSLEQEQGLQSGLLDAVWDRESGRGQHMVSPAGARGHFQFMPATWEKYGKGGSPDDLGASSDAAARYLHDLLKEFHGDTAKALAGYNWGQGNVEKDIAQYGDDWRKHLPPETSHYLDFVEKRLGSLSTQQGGTQQAQARQPSPHITITLRNETGGNPTISVAQIAV